jgi:hypothetical protein
MEIERRGAAGASARSLGNLTIFPAEFSGKTLIGRGFSGGNGAGGRVGGQAREKNARP